MSGSSFGNRFRVTTYGESHGTSIGCIVDGCPSGIPWREDILQYEMARRKPGQSRITTQRKEDDVAVVQSGVFENQTTGAPIALVIANADARSKDYSEIAAKYRPGHADYTFDQKYGFRDYRGGGRSSGRETATRVAAGAVARMILDPLGIDVWAYVQQVGHLSGKTVDRSLIETNPVRAADPKFADEAFALVDSVRKAGDSLGAVVEIRVDNVPPGLGEPVFDKLSARLAYALMGIGTVKGLEIGDGFASSARRGSENNDRFVPGQGRITKSSNRGGGILGGISDGDQLVVRCALKPTASILIEQDTVNRSGDVTTIQTKGRHDPLIAPRFVPVAEAMVRLVVVDFLLQQAGAEAVRTRVQSSLP